MQVGQSRLTTTTTTTTITITSPSGRGSFGSTTKYHGEGESDETRLFTHRVVAFGRAGDRNRYNPMGEAEEAGARGLARGGAGWIRRRAGWWPGGRGCRRRTAWQRSRTARCRGRG